MRVDLDKGRREKALAVLRAKAEAGGGRKGGGA